MSKVCQADHDNHLTGCKPELSEDKIRQYLIWDFLIIKKLNIFTTEEAENTEKNQRRDQIEFFNDHEALNEDTGVVETMKTVVVVARKL